MIFVLGSANVGEIQEFQSEVETVRTEVANLHVDVEQQTSKVNIYFLFEKKDILNSYLALNIILSF